MHKYLIKTIFYLLIFFSLLGCETTKKIYDVITDPKVPVGYPSESPTKVTLTFLSDDDINQNQDGDATPLEIEVIYLNEDSRFLSADYDELLKQGPQEIFGKNYIDHQEYTILPDQYKIIPDFELAAKTRFVGVIAHYADINNSYWADIIDVDAIGKKETLIIHIKTNEILIKKEDK